MSRKKPDNALHVRRFLNRDEGMAAIEASVHQDEGGGVTRYLNANVTITDCSRSVSLNLDMHYEKADLSDADKRLRDRLYKIDALADTLAAVRAQMVAIHKHIVRDLA